MNVFNRRKKMERNDFSFPSLPSQLVLSALWLVLRKLLTEENQYRALGSELVIEIFSNVS